MDVIRTRIAPSPTGPLHIGTARTALFNYLFAKKQGGAFALRIEDTDLVRSDPAYERDIIDGLIWLGIAPDEGPSAGGPYGPYRQSERLPSYGPPLERLLADGKAFWCFHGETELAAEREGQRAAKAPPVHWCKERDLPPAEAEGRRAAGERGIIRFRTERGRDLRFTDLIRGEIAFASDLLGDFSLAKDLKTPLYNFAVVIDDSEMQISHVIRGEDHIPNTPKQILIQEALGLPRPAYAHLPLILGPDRAKLSKRHGATAVRELREQGYLPEAMVNFMALLGWNPGGEREIFTMAELVERFDLGRVQKSGAVFNRGKLNWLNGEHIRQRSVAELTDLARPYLQQAVPEAQTSERACLERVVALEQPRLKKLSDIADAAYFFRPPEYPREILRWRDMTDGGVAESLRRSCQVIQATSETNFNEQALAASFFKEIGNGDRGEVLWPLRAALSGRPASAGPFEIMAVLGKERTLQYLYRAFRLLGEEPPAGRTP